VKRVLPYVDNSKLTSADNFLDVKVEVLGIAARWREFGSVLKIKPEKLAMIESSGRGDPEKCLDMVLTEFLKMNYETEKYGDPSWRLIVIAVGHRGGGNNTDRALQVANGHPSDSGRSVASGSSVTTTATGKASAEKSILKERPTMQLIGLITYRDGSSGKTKKFRPLSQISRYWRDIASHLKVSDGAIANAEVKTNVMESAREVIQFWINAKEKATWSKLIRAMEVREELTVAAQELETALLNMVEDSDDEDD
jgi:hypothetical protein